MIDKPKTKRAPHDEEKFVRTPSSNPVNRVQKGGSIFRKTDYLTIKQTQAQRVQSEKMAALGGPGGNRRRTSEPETETEEDQT